MLLLESRHFACSPSLCGDIFHGHALPCFGDNSIINQKKLLEDYAKEHGFTNCVHFTDDGWSGANFDRPNWKRMIAAIEAGEVSHVLVKDLSRVGRDYLQVGFYTEVMSDGQEPEKTEILR